MDVIIRRDVSQSAALVRRLVQGLVQRVIQRVIHMLAQRLAQRRVQRLAQRLADVGVGLTAIPPTYDTVVLFRRDGRLGTVNAVGALS